MAIGARRERGLFDPDAAPGESPFDHQIYVFASDGDIEEGVTSEASSLAGTQQLGNLTVVYDDNQISIEDDTTIALSEDTAKRYEAYGWHVQVVESGENVTGILAALENARAETQRPSFILLRTIIGYPAPNKMNTGKAHGSALGADEVKAVKELLGFDPEKSFVVAAEVLTTPGRWSTAAARRTRPGRRPTNDWAAREPERKELLERMLAATCRSAGEVAARLGDRRQGLATRKASGEVLKALADVLPSVGRLGRPGREQQHQMEGADSFGPTSRSPPRCGRPALRPHPALRGARARHGSQS